MIAASWWPFSHFSKSPAHGCGLFRYLLAEEVNAVLQKRSNEGPGSDTGEASQASEAAEPGRASTAAVEDAVLAAERFAAAHYDDVFRYCLRHVGSKEDAQDVTQEVFLRIVRSGGSYVDHGKPLAYLYTVARNACADFHRTRHAATVEIREDVPDPAGERGVDDVAMADLLARLGEDEREAIALAYDQGLGVGEVAQVMGVSRFAVRRTTKRALAKLERMMRE